MIRALLGLGLVAGLGATASAQPLSGEAAQALLFAATGSEVEMLAPGLLPDDQVELLRQVGATQPYYGAIAVSPDEGIMVEATVAAANHHSVEAASAEALAACDARRKGAKRCAVVALIRPAGWAERAFQLSSGATAGFVGDYAKVRRDKAFAVSPSTGGWGVAKGRDAATKAVQDCATKPPQPADCRVVVQD